ncbi:MAG: GNAT family N-acetyltransferase [Clostridiales Family XIII bacterium]|jgi:ribosomal protein S18 acetylase RimI-like enzyme|nr:GNAT family N-acetyltransferase [Clostridiales Family XIII bacterium]
MRLSIRETKDYDSLVKLFIRNDLEYTEDDEITTDIIKQYGAYDTAKYDPECKLNSDVASLIGGIVLAKRENRFICDGIAIDAEYRNLDLGERLLKQIIEDAKNLGADALYLVARAPGFFKKYGFFNIPKDDAPTFFECFTCPQYNKTCHPEVLKLAIMK